MAGTRIVAMTIAAATLLQPTTAPARIAVVGNDYAFVGVPAKIAAGPTLFSFDNKGKFKHEMTVVLLAPGITVQDVLQGAPAAASSRAVAQSLIGILIARRGEAAGGQLLVELQSGQHYLVICSLKDAPDSQPHAQLGMITSFDVP